MSRTFRMLAAPKWAVEVTPGGIVAADVNCHHCGYDLRTLRVTANCPECNTPVRASLRGDQLAFADPQWLKTVALGARMLSVAGVGGFISTALWSLFGKFHPAAEAIGKAGVFLAIAATLVGSWLMTLPDPSGIGEDKYAMVRKAARALLILGFAGLPLSTIEDKLA